MNAGLLLLRLVIGLTLAAHGSQKLFGWFDGPRIDGFAGMLDRLGIRPSRPFAIVAGLAEFGGGVLLALGFLTPLGAAAAASAMIVAIVAVHLPRGFFNTGGGLEYPLVMLTAAATLALTGPGAISLDGALGIRFPEPVTVIVLAILVALGAAATLGTRQLAAAQRRQLG